MTRNIVILIAALLVIAFVTRQAITAQGVQVPSAPGAMLTLAQPLVLAGPDVGFRVVRMDGQIPVGEIVVRINGSWVVADAAK